MCLLWEQVIAFYYTNTCLELKGCMSAPGGKGFFYLKGIVQ